MKYLQTFSQFQHVYKKRYQFTASHLIANHEVTAVVEDGHFKSQLRDLKNTGKSLL